MSDPVEDPIEKVAVAREDERIERDEGVDRENEQADRIAEAITGDAPA